MTIIAALPDEGSIPVPTAPDAHLAPPVRFAELIAARRRDADLVHFDVPHDWQQGITAFGGLVAAMASCALRDVLGPRLPLRALQVNFIGPVPAGPTQIQVRTLREGKSITQAQAIVTANDQTACLVSAVLGAPRANTLITHAPTFTPSRQPESLTELPFTPGKTPIFFQHFRSRWAEGDPPSTGGNSLHSKIWLQLQGAAVPRELLTILFADAMPSPVMGTTKSQVFGASLAWTIEFLETAQSADNEGWWRADTELVAHSQGYANQLTTIWTPQGEAAARSQQVMAIYA